MVDSCVCVRIVELLLKLPHLILHRLELNLHHIHDRRHLLISLVQSVLILAERCREVLIR